MKKLKTLEDFENGNAVNETGPVPARASQKVKARFSLSNNLKKVSKIQKTLIDLTQMLVEMSDEIVVLKMGFSNIDPESLNVLTNMKYNLDNMVNNLKRERKGGGSTGMIDNSRRLQRNLEKMKTEFISSGTNK